MGAYRYKAVNPRNELVEGEIEAASEAEAFQGVESLGLFPVEAAETAGTRGLLDWLKTDISLSKSGSRRDIVMLTQQLATLLRSGVELETALSILAALCDRDTLRDTVTRVRDEVRGGASLADGLDRHFSSLPAYYVSMIRAGESGGKLEQVCDRLGAFLKNSQDLRDSIVGQLIYPAVLLATAGASLVVLVGVVLPQFEPIFQDAGAAMPFAARALLAMGDVFAAYWWLFLAGAGLAVAGARVAMTGPRLSRAVHAGFLRVPVIGSVLWQIDIGRYTRTLGTLLLGGVPALSALTLAHGTVGNRAISSALSPTAGRVQQGASLSAALAETAGFPTLAKQLIAVGEESGQLEPVLVQVADLLDQEAAQHLQRLVALLTPVLTIVLGGLIAGLIASVLLAVLSINELAI